MAERFELIVTGNTKQLIGELKRAGVEVKQFTRAAGQGSGDVQKLNRGVVNLSSAAAALGLGGAAAGLIAFGKASFSAAAQAERLGRGTDNLAQGIGESGDSMVSAIQGASNKTIDSLTAMQAANKAMMFGLVDNAGQMRELTQVAVTLGAAMGQDAAKSIDDLTTALGRQSPMILDNLGITLKMDEAYRIYAGQLGKTVESLTEQEKKQAFVNAALAKGQERVQQLGGVTLDTAGQTEQLSASWSDFNVAFGGMLTKMSGGMSTITAVVNQMAEGARSYSWMIDVMSAGLPVTDETNRKFEEIRQRHRERTAAGRAAAEAERRLAETARMGGLAAMYEAQEVADLAAAAQEAAGQMDALGQASAGYSAARANNAAAQRYTGIAGADETVLLKQTGLTGVEAQQMQQLPDVMRQIEDAGRSAASSIKSGFKDAFSGLDSAIRSQLQPTLQEVWKPLEDTSRADEAARQLAAVYEGALSGSFDQNLPGLIEQFGGQEFFSGVVDAFESQDTTALADAAGTILNDAFLRSQLLDVELIKSRVRDQLAEQQLMQQLTETIRTEMLGEQQDGEGVNVMAGLLGVDETGLAGIQTGLAGVGETTTEATGTMVENFDSVAVKLNEINTVTMPAVQAAGKIAFAGVGAAATEAAKSAEKGMQKAANKITGTLIPAVNRAAKAFDKMREAAERAAGAAHNAGSAAPGGSFGGGRAAGGPVSAGSLYLVGERGPELFIPPGNGVIAPFRENPPAQVAVSGGGGGNSLTIQNVTLYGVQDVRRFFDELQRVARARGLQFAAVQ